MRNGHRLAQRSQRLHRLLPRVRVGTLHPLQASSKQCPRVQLLLGLLQLRLVHPGHLSLFERDLELGGTVAGIALLALQRHIQDVIGILGVHDGVRRKMRPIRLPPLQRRRVQFHGNLAIVQRRLVVTKCRIGLAPRRKSVGEVRSQLQSAVAVLDGTCGILSQTLCLGPRAPSLRQATIQIQRSVQVLSPTGQVACDQPRPSTTRQDDSILRLELHSSGGILDCSCHIVPVKLRPCAVEPRSGATGIQTDGLGTIRHRALRVELIQLRAAARGPGVGQKRVELDGIAGRDGGLSGEPEV
mmetsp:Transcript_138113/g.441274  ORF Transcript_138113/g.441274 Transcript_138113/m.441274 type:complete len:300 (-) Transcript_138113:1396-2295(-)